MICISAAKVSIENQRFPTLTPAAAMHEIVEALSQTLRRDLSYLILK